MSIGLAARGKSCGLLIAVLLALLLAQNIVIVEHGQLFLGHIFIVAVFCILSHHLLEMLLGRGIGLVDRDDFLLEFLQELLEPWLGRTRLIALLTGAADVHAVGRLLAGASRLV